MVMSHDWPGKVSVMDSGSTLILSSPAADGYTLNIQKSPLKLTWFQNGKSAPVLEEKDGIVWETVTLKGPRKGGKELPGPSFQAVSLHYKVDADEHFAGSGGPSKLETRPLDLRGRRIENTYRARLVKNTELYSSHGRMIIPFFVSSKGYGIFINSTYSTLFDFGYEGNFRLSLMTQTDADYTMDYFFIAGPNLMNVVERYTDLTGKPRLFPRAFFGLQLTDRGGHKNYDKYKDNVAELWEDSVATLREKGYPLDGVMFDNLWRAGGGTIFKSRFEWNLDTIKDPAAFGEWIKKEGLVLSLDLNRQNNYQCKGWKPEYTIGGWEPSESRVAQPESCPDYSSPEVREWSWNLIASGGFGPDGNWPMDAVWVDGTDNIDRKPEVVLQNGWLWDEGKNYYPYWIAQTFVKDGWDKTIGKKQRPFIWNRCVTPGTQRYTVHWSGDIDPRLDVLEQQVVNLQASGIAGFAYFNHDAGGFKKGITEALYRQWSAAFGSFTPIWRPHGLGPINSRRPDAWGEEAQKEFMTYATTRYEMIPYIYSYAHESAASGTPMARAMFLSYADEKAWDFPHQYMWGEELLVAPNVTEAATKELWLPKGEWFDLWTKAKVRGDRIFTQDVPLGQIPVYVKAGAIIPKSPYRLSTAFIPNDELLIDLYLGADGAFTLMEDDNVTENYRDGEIRKTRMVLKDGARKFVIYPAEGTFNGAPKTRQYAITLYGLTAKSTVKVNGRNVAAEWDAESKGLSFILPKTAVNKAVAVSW